MNPREVEWKAKWIWHPEKDKWKAKWTWHLEKDNMKNFYLYGRKTIDIEADLRSAKAYCTACNQYKLYVNGEYLGRGPSPCDPHWQYYDEYDLAPYLKKGENVISLICYNYGEGTESVIDQTQGRGGFLFQGEIELANGEAMEILSDESWKLLQSPSWYQNTPRLNNWVGYRELYYAGKEEYGWQEAGYDDSHWLAPEVLGTPPVEPWTNLIPREIPFLQTTEILPASVFRIDDNLGKIGYTQNLLTDNESCAVIDATRPGSFPSLVLDFGREVVGYIRLKIRDAEEGIVMLSYGESLDLYSKPVDRLVLRSGSTEWSPYDRRAFRYLQVTFHACPKPVLVESITLDLIHYPYEYRGDFSCSDEQLDNIWQLGRYSTLLGTQDHYEDSIWRERALWVGDMRVMSLADYYAFGDIRIVAKCLRQIARIQREDGALPGTGPQANRHLLPDFCAYWVIILNDYYNYSGDSGLVAELYPNLGGVMDWFASNLDENGLIGNADREGWWCFIDWAEIDKRDEVTALNCLYYEALRCAARMAEALGESERAKEWDSTADKVKRAINDRLWSEELGVYVDCRTSEGMSNHVTQQTNALAIAYNIAEESKWSGIHNYIYDEEKVTPTSTPFFNSMILEFLFGEKEDTQALNLIRDYWGEMMRRGATTTWEMFDRQTSEVTVPFAYLDQMIVSYCHGWSAGPTYLLPKWVLGVIPTRAGFNEFEVKPRVGDLRWAKGKVPTPKGDIEVSWERGEEDKSFRMEVTVPTELKTTLAVPKLKDKPYRLELNGLEVDEETETVKIRKGEDGYIYFAGLTEGNYEVRLTYSE